MYFSSYTVCTPAEGDIATFLFLHLVVEKWRTGAVGASSVELLAV